MVSRVPWLILLVGLAGCDDPTRILETPPELDRSMVLMGILDPDSAIQQLAVGAVGLAERFGSGAERLIDGLSAEVFVDGERLVRAVQDTTYASDAWLPCVVRYGSDLWRNCLHLDFRPTSGVTYTIRVTADGRPTAVAEVRIPGDFRIKDASTAGHPPGTEGLSVHWSRSQAAHRYFVALRASNNDCKLDSRGCPGGWYAATADTVLEAVVPRRELSHGSGTWYIDVYALDRALYEFLTTGTGGDFFSVPPTSNVEGGHGVVGAWIRRSYGAGS